MKWPSLRLRRQVRVDNSTRVENASGLAPAVYRHGPLPRGALVGGGFVNPATGAGGLADKSEHGFFEPTRFVSRWELETIYVQSWAVRKFIDIPVDDMLIRWRQIVGDDAASVEAMADAETRHKVRQRLAGAMKAGRLAGTAFLVMATAEAPLNEPLSIERLRPGDLMNLLVFDRFEAVAAERDTNPFSPGYGQPLRYTFTGRGAPVLRVDASRVLRFDGLTPVSSSGWQAYDQDWGVSELVPIVTSILQDATIAGGVAHLTTEASVPVIRLSNFRDALAREGAERGELSPSEMGEQINLHRSLYRTLFMDREDEFQRVSVNFGGLAELMDRFAKRLAAAADIPATRFWGQSPVGLNATGESDMRNYALRVAALQESMLTGPLALLDAVLARDAGLSEPPEYQWLSLLDLSEAEQAQTAKTRAEAVNIAVTAGLVDENEGRAALDGDAVFGTLEPLDVENAAAS